MKKAIIQDVFYFLSILLAAFCLLEIIFPNIILVYFNINYLFLLWFMVGLTLLIKK